MWDYTVESGSTQGHVDGDHILIFFLHKGDLFDLRPVLNGVDPVSLLLPYLPCESSQLPPRQDSLKDCASLPSFRSSFSLYLEGNTPEQHEWHRSLRILSIAQSSILSESTCSPGSNCDFRVRNRNLPTAVCWEDDAERFKIQAKLTAVSACCLAWRTRLPAPFISRGRNQESVLPLSFRNSHLPQTAFGEPPHSEAQACRGLQSIRVLGKIPNPLALCI